MTSEEYCYQKAAPPGSAFYYSLLKIPNQKRDTVAAIAAFYQELNDIIYECHDLALAHIKFNWWRNEIAKLNKGVSDHPVMLTLQKNAKEFHLSPPPFQAMLDSVEQNLNLSLFETMEDITFHIINTAGARELLIANLTPENENIPTEIIYSLAMVIELVERIQYLRRDIQRGFIFFGADELLRYHVSLEMLQSLKLTPEIKNLLQYQQEKMSRAYSKALSQLTPQQKSSLLSLIIRAEIAYLTLQEIQRNGYQVFESFTSLTPLRRWWVAQKTLFKTI